MKIRRVFPVIASFFFIAASAMLVLAESDPETQDVIILSKKGYIDDVFTQNLKKESFEYKLKYLTQKGIDEHGTATLYYSPSKENIGDIRGTVYLPDGKTVEITEKDILKKEVVQKNKYRRKKMEVNIVFPSLTEGAIVEYSYYKTFNNILKRMSYWAFQGKFKTLHSEVTFQPWPGLRWGYTFRNPIGEPEIRKSQPGGNTSITVIRENIPPLSEEPHSLPYDYLRESMYFYYQDSNIKYDDYWKEWGDVFYKREIKKLIKACSESKRIVQEHFKDKLDRDDLIPLLHEYVIAHYFSIDTLSKKESEQVNEKYLEKLGRADTIGELFKFNILNPEKVNFILGSLIHAAVPDAVVELVMYTPWDEDIFNPELKTLAQFSQVMLKVTHKGKIFWLSPSRRFMKANMIEWGARGIQVLVLGDNGSHIEKLPLDKHQDNPSLIKATVSFDTGEDYAVFDRRRECDPYESYSSRAELLFFTEQERKDYLEGELKDSFGDDVKLLSYEILNLDDFSKPLILVEQFKFPFVFEEAGNEILFRFPGLIRYTENPFHADTRKDNIYYPYPFQDVQEMTYKLPETVIIKSLPENVRINKNVFTCNMDYTKIDNHQLSVKVVTILDGNMLSKKAFTFLKDTYRDILEAGRKTAILKEE